MRTISKLKRGIIHVSNMFAATRKCPTAVKDTQSLVNMIITSGILLESGLINGHNDAGADVSKHALLLCLASSLHSFH